MKGANETRKSPGRRPRKQATPAVPRTEQPRAEVPEMAGLTLEQRRDLAAAEALEALTWGMRHAASKSRQLRCASLLAQLGTPKPIAKIDMSATITQRESQAETIRRRRAERLAASVATAI